MADDLGSLAVSFTADLSGLTSGAQAAKDQIASVGESAQSSSGGFLSGIGGMVGGLVNFGSQIGMTIFGIQSLFNTATSLGSALLGPAATAEQTQVAFETLTGSASKAADEMNQLNTFAASTPFQTQAIDNAAEKLLAFGFNSKKVIPDITGIGDALSALGKGSEANLNGVIDIFGKIQAQGKLTGGDMMQLSTYGIPAWKMLSDVMGIPVDRLQKMVSQGLVPAGTALDGLQKGMEQTFGGGMAKQASTFNGQLSTLQSNATIAWAAFTGPGLKMAEDGLGKLGALVASPGFQHFATMMGQQLAGGLTNVGTAIGKIISIGQGLVGFFQHNQVAADLLIGALVAIGSIALAFAIMTIPTMVTAFIAWAAAAWAAAAGTIAATWPILAIGVVIALVVAGIILAVQHWGEIAHWLQGIWAGISGFFINDIIHPIGNAFSAFGSFMHGIWDGIVGVFKGAINGIITGINDFIGFIDSLQIHIPSIGVGPIHTPAFDWNGLGIPKIPLLATGGFLSSGQMGIAGEAGPELIFGGATGSNVLSAAQTQALLGGSQDIHVHVYLDSQEMTNTIGTNIVNMVRATGPVGRVA